MPELFYQGSGIQKFFSELKIMQYFYTRHIINTVGAYSYLEKLIGKNNLIKILIRNYISLLNHPPLEEYEQTMVLIDSLTVWKLALSINKYIPFLLSLALKQILCKKTVNFLVLIGSVERWYNKTIWFYCTD